MKKVNKKRFSHIYRGLEHNLKTDFFNPLLDNAKKYYAATGYFTLSGFVELIEYLIPIIKNGGEIIIITSPLVDKDDINLIEFNEFDRDYIESLILSEIEEYKLSGNNDLEIKLLASLIKEEMITLKIVYKKTGIFHEKIGYVEKFDNSKIAYNGSANLTYSGLFSNIESLAVFDNDFNDEVVEDTRKYLEKLCNGEYDTIKILNIEESIKDNLLTFIDKNETVSSLISKIEMDSNHDLIKENTDKKENTVNLRDYQKRAIMEFIENDYVHFFEMATGERVIIVMDAICVIKSRVSGTFNEYNSCITESN